MFKSIAMAALLSMAIPGRAEGDESLLLEVYVNGHTTGKIGEFVMRDVAAHGVIRHDADPQGPTAKGGELKNEEPKNRELLVRRSELAELGFRQPNPQKLLDPNDAAASELVAMSEIQGLTMRIDAATQSLYITVPNERLVPTSLLADDGVLPAGRVHIESGTGTTVNYDVTSTFAGGQNSLNGALDMRAFSPRGVLSSGVLGYVANSAGGGPATTSLVRLDTTYTIGEVNTLRRYSVGDFITTGLSFTRPVRMEGVQARSDFTMRPDLVTFPLPTVSGSVAVPSAVDVLTNGNLVISRQIDAGPFEIPQLPVASGAGTITMTVTNALGQQVRIAQPFYASAALLRPGLENFSAQAGLVRLNWGVISNDYGKLAASTTYRRGMTSKFTLEADAEGTPGVLMGGGGGLLQVGDLGVLNFAVAASGGSGGPGGQLTLGVQRLGRMFSAGASAMATTPGFQDVAARNGEGVPRRQVSANLSFSLRRWGSLGVFYAGLDRASSLSQLTPTVAPAGSQTGTPAQQTQVLSASYSRSLRHMSFFVNAYQDYASGGSPGIQAGFTMPIGRRQSLELSTGSDGTGQVQVQRSAVEVGEWGYQAYAAAGDGTHEFAQTQYKSRYALLTAGVDSSAGVNTVRLETQGAVSVMDGRLFPSNTIYDSFAIVDTGSATRIHVLQENREVGSTGTSGRLLVADLRSYDINRLAIVPTDVGLDTTIQQSRREVRPQDRSGVLVRFEVTISHAALLVLVDEAGVALPVGSSARLRGSRESVPVGYDGDAYVENLRPHNEVEVLWPDGHTCVAAFNYKPLEGEIPKIGPLRCVTQRARQITRTTLRSSLDGGTDAGPDAGLEPDDAAGTNAMVQVGPKASVEAGP